MAEGLRAASQWKGWSSQCLEFSERYSDKSRPSSLLGSPCVGLNLWDPWYSTRRSSSRRHRGIHSESVSSRWSCFPSQRVFTCNLGRQIPVWNEKSSKSRTGCSVAAAAAMGRKEVQFPSPDFDFRAETREDTLAVVSSSYPGLMDIVEDGSLLVVQRPEGYSERRLDGFREPEMVFVVGTAHMSVVSAAQVERVVKAVRPENVVVELCRSRAGIMYDDSSTVSSRADDPGTTGQNKPNLMSLSGENFGAAISRTLRLGGRSALGLRLLLGGMSQRISKSAGVDTGAEFRAARKAAEEIGSQIVLGDRPIEVTLQRAWEALKWNERFRLANIFLQAMMSSDLDLSEGALQVLKSDDALSAMFTEMGVQLPSLLQPLIYERDLYLAWSLKRSKAVNGCSRVVGVVGKGHMRGVIYNLRHNQENLRFKDLVGTRESEDKRSKVEKLITNLLVETAIGGMLWLLWDHFLGK